MEQETPQKRAYRWHIDEDRRKELNRERYEHMRRGREAKRQQPAQPVNTPAAPNQD